MNKHTPFTVESIRNFSVLEIAESLVFVYFHSATPNRVILESLQRGSVSLGGAYSATKHSPHNPPPHGKYHIHVYERQEQIFSINLDGSAHDQSHGVRIPNRVVKGLKKHFPDLALPKGQIIECLTQPHLGTIWLTAIEKGLEKVVEDGLIEPLVVEGF